jgi:UDP-GlcNAc:undecaprenyl-phosphate GlcNAc-1-phosphate transferase
MSLLLESSWRLLAGGGAALLCALALTPLVIRVAHRRGWVDRPKADRWHEESTALMGGIAIFAAFTAAFAAGALVLAEPLPWALWGGAALMFGAGLTDDLRGLSPAAKLIAQLGATLLLLYAGYAFGKGGPYWLYIPFTFLWVIGITNAVNLLDNMDGLAAGIASIAAFVLAVYAAMAGGTGSTWALGAVGGAAAGFLVYNFKPARVFMGDSGSLFLGYVIAAFTTVVQGHISGPQGLAVYLVSAAVLAVPIFDTTLVTVTRALSGRAVSQGGRDHSSHRLVRLGLSERRAVVTLYVVSLACGALALFFYFSETHLFYALTVFFVVALGVFGVHLGGANVHRNKGGPKPRAGTANGHAATDGHATTDEVLSTGDGASASASLARPTTVQKGIVATRALLGQRWKSVVQLVADLLLVAAAFVLAHYLRFEGGLDARRETMLISTLPAVVALKLLVFWAGRLYSGLWQHAGTPELMRVVKGTLGASVLCYGALGPFYGLSYLSEATFIIDWMIVTLAVIGVRFGFRGLRQYLSSKRQRGRRVLLYGAGDSGQLTLRGLRQRPDLGMVPVGFIDDDPAKRGLVAQGVAVLGTFDDLEAICRQHEVEEVLITTFRLPEARKQNILARCRALDVDCRVFNLALRSVEARPARVDS